MFDIYKGVKNSLHGLTSALKIAIANADNFNTPGYKYMYATFTTVYQQAIQGGLDNINPKTIPGSMALGSTTTDTSQGNLSFGVEKDAAIVGYGYFILSKSPTVHPELTNLDGGSNYLTRAGRFITDYNNEYLTTDHGYKVYGYKITNGVVDKSKLVPIKTDGNKDIGFSEDGILVTNFNSHKAAVEDGSENIPKQDQLYQLALSGVQNEQGLIMKDGGVYEITAASGDLIDPETANNSIYGDIQPQRLESSNVDVAKVALDMNLLNRGFSAIQGVVDDINKILSNVINKLGSG